MIAALTLPARQERGDEWADEGEVELASRFADGAGGVRGEDGEDAGPRLRETVIRKSLSAAALEDVGRPLRGWQRRRKLRR